MRSLLPSSVFRLPSSVFRLPSSVSRLPCPVFRVPSSVSRFLPYVLRPIPQAGDHPAPSCASTSRPATRQPPTPRAASQRTTAGSSLPSPSPEAAAREWTCGVGVCVLQKRRAPSPTKIHSARRYRAQMVIDDVAGSITEQECRRGAAVGRNAGTVLEEDHQQDQRHEQGEQYGEMRNLGKRKGLLFFGGQTGPGIQRRRVRLPMVTAIVSPAAVQVKRADRRLLEVEDTRRVNTVDDQSQTDQESGQRDEQDLCLVETTQGMGNSRSVTHVVRSQMDPHATELRPDRLPTVATHCYITKQKTTGASRDSDSERRPAPWVSGERAPHSGERPGWARCAASPRIRVHALGHHRVDAKQSVRCRPARMFRLRRRGLRDRRRTRRRRGSPVRCVPV